MKPHSRGPAYPVDPLGLQEGWTEDLKRFAALVPQKLELEEFFSLEEPFRELLRSEVLRDLAKNALTRMVAAPDHTPYGGFSSTGLSLARCESWTMTLRFLRPGAEFPKTLQSTSEHCLLGVPAHTRAASCVEMRTWRQIAPHPVDVLRPGAGLASPEDVLVDSEHLLRVRAAEDLVCYVPSSQLRVVAVLTSSTVVPFQWQYDIESGEPTRIIAAYPDSSRIDVALRLLHTVADESSAAVVADLTKHPDHYVRWTAVRVLFALDKAAGTEALSEALLDPHPHVRAAAKDATESLVGAA